MSGVNFQMPQKVVVDQIDENNGIFIFEPLEKGYGVTVGNALRRVLLSSLEGYAIKSIKIPGVLHEFSMVEGVVEDLMEIILNLKKVRFKKTGDVEENTINISIKNSDRFFANDIGKASSSFTILNPDLVICNLSKDIEFNIELSIGRGRGYVSAEENKPLDQVIGTIAIDSIYTPIKNVKYYVDNTRVGQRIDYEKLSVEVKTDGSLDSETAMREATDILIKHFALLSTKGVNFEPMIDLPEEEIMDDETLKIRKLLQTSINRLNLSVRAHNCLKSANIYTLGELAKLKVEDMLKFRNLGKKSLTELKVLMEDKGLKFGMDISKYKLEEEL